MAPPRCVPLQYSLKNIPIPRNDVYMKALIEKVESLIKRMRWRAHFFLRGSDSGEADAERTRPKLNSRKCPPQVEELAPFESDMLRLIESIEFRRVTDHFQDTLENDMREIKSSSEIIVRADKTRNLYKMSVDQYDKLLHENVTKHYKFAPARLYDDINVEAQRIARRLQIADRMDVLAKNEAFLTLKDHKENFTSHLPCRLINPCKSEMGIISKRILEKAVNEIRKKTQVNLWKNTAAVIDWFQSIDDKEQRTFLCFDIVDFYPSISEDLLRETIDFVKQYVRLTNDEVEVIFHARKSLLFKNGGAWMKRDKDSAFDVTMGSYDGAEVCELVGVFLLNKLSPVLGRTDSGLYRDDGLAALKRTPGHDADAARKRIIHTMKHYGLRITIETNLRTANFLDVTFDLPSGRFFPFRKPNDHPLYINAASNHPPSILRNLPAAISKRLSSISCDEQAFQDAASPYEEALAASGFPRKMCFVQPEQYQQKRRRDHQRQRQRHITWFNPPFSRSVKTNIGRKFLSLVSKHFPKGSVLNKIFNRATLKVSYSCLPNVASIISSNNRKLRRDKPSEKLCNCRVKDQCPLQGNCQSECVVYKAAVTNMPSGDIQHYIGATAPPFKQRFANHLTSFRHERYENSTELSKHMWNLKRQEIDTSITWSVLAKAPVYSAASKKCQLCLTEKLRIISWPQDSRLNKRQELVSTCRHARKILLSNFSPTVS